MNRKLLHSGTTFLHCGTRRTKTKPKKSHKWMLTMERVIKFCLQCPFAWRSWSLSVRRVEAAAVMLNYSAITKGITNTLLSIIMSTSLILLNLIFLIIFWCSSCSEDGSSLFRHCRTRTPLLFSGTGTRNGNAFSIQAANACAGWYQPPYLQQAPQFPGQSHWHN